MINVAHVLGGFDHDGDLLEPVFASHLLNNANTLIVPGTILQKLWINRANDQRFLQFNMETTGFDETYLQLVFIAPTGRIITVQAHMPYEQPTYFDLPDLPATPAYQGYEPISRLKVADPILALPLDEDPTGISYAIKTSVSWQLTNDPELDEQSEKDATACLDQWIFDHEYGDHKYKIAASNFTESGMRSLQVVSA